MVAVALIQFWLAMPVALYGTLAILLLAYVGRYIPLSVRAANASLRQVDPSLEESAQILGASWLTTMREITLPLIRPGLFAGWLLVFVPVIQELSASILLFSSSSITFAVAVYNLYETGYFEPVAALAMINMLIIGAAIWLAHWLGGRSLTARADAAPVKLHLGDRSKEWRASGSRDCRRASASATRSSRPWPNSTSTSRTTSSSRCWGRAVAARRRRCA